MIFGQDKDGDLIKETLDEHKYSLKNALYTTNHRLNQLKFSEVQEAWIEFGAMVFFHCVCLYIMLKRTGLLYGLLWLFDLGNNQEEEHSEL